jgi:hypothetical protein
MTGIHSPTRKIADEEKTQRLIIDCELFTLHTVFDHAVDWPEILRTARAPNRWMEPAGEPRGEAG